MERPTQISLARLFVVVTLVAVSFGSGFGISYLDTIRARGPGLLGCTLTALAWTCPFLALGVFAHRAWIGLAFGLFAAIGIFVLMQVHAAH